jgi:ubiquinone biosynthesis protein COQ4
MNQPPKYDLKRARRALRALLANPDDTRQVFEIIEALAGSTGDRMLARLRKTPSGKRLLADRPSLLDVLSDRKRLEALPPQSFGRAYVEFLKTENISPEGLVEASEIEHADRQSDDRWVHDRMRDSHDLWHVATGYSGDLVGEGALLAFIFAQTWHPGVGLIVFAGLVSGMRVGEMRSPALEFLRGFWRGVRAEWLPGVEWETLLAEPLESVREKLRTGAPPSYQVVRSSELPATGLL